MPELAAVRERVLTSAPAEKIAAPLWRSRAVRGARRALVRAPGNASLEGIHQGRRAFVIGHGRSILGQDLTRLHDEVVFCLNNFFYHPQYHQIAPDFHCAQDPSMLRMPRRREWYEMHEAKGTSSVPKLFNAAARRVDRRNHLFQNHEVHYLHASSATEPPLWEQDVFPVDLTRPLAPFGIVAFDIAIPAALYMGVKQIVLIGFDGGAVKTLEDYKNLNFYGMDPLGTEEEYERNFQRFFYEGSKHEEERAALWEQSVPVIERTMAARGAEIVNATPVGKVFPGIRRVRFEDLLG